MTNADDLVLLKSHEFRKQCAEVVVKTVCEWFDVEYGEHMSLKEENRILKIELEDIENILKR